MPADDSLLAQGTVDARDEGRRAYNAGEPTYQSTRFYTIRQTDCRTGWQVVDRTGRVHITSRIKSTADRACREMNYLHYNEPGA